LEFAVQLKSTDNESARRLRVGVDWDHIRFWQRLAYPTLIVRHCAFDGSTYARWVHERARTRSGHERKQAWFAFTEADRLSSMRWPAIAQDVAGFRYAREGRVRMPLRLRLEADPPDPAFQLTTNAAFARLLGVDQITLDSSATTSLRVIVRTDSLSIDFGGGMAIRIGDTQGIVPAPLDLLFLIGLVLGRCGAHHDAAKCLSVSTNANAARSPKVLSSAVAYCSAAGDLDTASTLLARYDGDTYVQSALVGVLLGKIDDLGPGARSTMTTIRQNAVESAATPDERGIALFNLACQFRSFGNHADAVQCFRSAVAERPAYQDRADFWRYSAGAQFMLGEYALAAEGYHRALELGDDDPDTRMLLADSLLGAGQYRQISRLLSGEDQVTPDELLIRLVADSILERFEIEFQERDPITADRVAAGDTRSRIAIAGADALHPAAWVSGVGPGGTVDPIGRIVHARLVDTDAPTWGLALVMAAMCKIPQEVIVACIRRAKRYAGPDFDRFLVEIVTSVSESCGPEDKDSLNVLLTSAAVEHRAMTREFVLRDADSGLPMLKLDSGR
jgi:tetratricopeptide (TPR) repeat protein